MSTVTLEEAQGQIAGIDATWHEELIITRDQRRLLGCPQNLCLHRSHESPAGAREC